MSDEPLLMALTYAHPPFHTKNTLIASKGLQMPYGR